MSPGTGADITLQDAYDLLQKWLTENTTVQVSFASGGGVTAYVKGKLGTDPNSNKFGVSEPKPVMGSPMIFFDPSIAVSCKYGDKRAFGDLGTKLAAIGAPRMLSALVFVLTG
jgi:hypothetical protein